MTLSNKEIKEVVDEFENDFREYLDASIRFAELQDPYQPLSSEDEIKWLKDRVKKIINIVIEKHGSKKRN